MRPHKRRCHDLSSVQNMGAAKKESFTLTVTHGNCHEAASQTEREEEEEKKKLQVSGIVSRSAARRVRTTHCMNDWSRGFDSDVDL